MRRTDLHRQSRQSLEHLLFRPAQREPIAAGVAAFHPGLLRAAGEAVTLPGRAVAQRWKFFVHDCVAVADALGALRLVRHLERIPPLEIAVLRPAGRPVRHPADIATECRAVVVLESLTIDIPG